MCTFMMPPPTSPSILMKCDNFSLFLAHFEAHPMFLKSPFSTTKSNTRPSTNEATLPGKISNETRNIPNNLDNNPKKSHNVDICLVDSVPVPSTGSNSCSPNGLITSGTTCFKALSDREVEQATRMPTHSYEPADQKVCGLPGDYDDCESFPAIEIITEQPLSPGGPQKRIGQLVRWKMMLNGRKSWAPEYQEVFPCDPAAEKAYLASVEADVGGEWAHEHQINKKAVLRPFPTSVPVSLGVFMQMREWDGSGDGEEVVCEGCTEEEHVYNDYLQASNGYSGATLNDEQCVLIPEQLLPDWNQSEKGDGSESLDRGRCSAPTTNAKNQCQSDNNPTRHIESDVYDQLDIWIAQRMAADADHIKWELESNPTLGVSGDQCEGVDLSDEQDQQLVAWIEEQKRQEVAQMLWKLAKQGSSLDGRARSGLSLLDTEPTAISLMTMGDTGMTCSDRWIAACAAFAIAFHCCSEFTRLWGRPATGDMMSFPRGWNETFD